MAMIFFFLLQLNCRFVYLSVDKTNNRFVANLSLFSGFYYNNTCWGKAVGLETDIIPDNNITASSYIDSSPPSAARLGSHVGWCPGNPINAFLQVDLGSAYYICAVATQGRPEGNFDYVKHYVIQLSLNGKNWTEYEQVEARTHTRKIHRNPLLFAICYLLGVNLNEFGTTY